jgi:hypothetical protein
MGWKHRKFAYVLATQYTLNTGQRSTLDHIADHLIEAQGDCCNLSNSNLAHKVGCSLSTVIRHVRALERVSELVQSRVSGSANHYIMRLPEGFEGAEFNTYQADVKNPQSNKQRMSNWAEQAKNTVESLADNSDVELYTDSVPGVSDWAECKRIHTEIVNDPVYGKSPGERIKNAIVLAKHPMWSDTGTTQTKPLPYNQKERYDGLETPRNRHENDPKGAQ